jgi:hypothetical protein
VSFSNHFVHTFLQVGELILARLLLSTYLSFHLVLELLLVQTGSGKLIFQLDNLETLGRQLSLSLVSSLI